MTQRTLLAQQPRWNAHRFMCDGECEPVARNDLCQCTAAEVSRRLPKSGVASARRFRGRMPLCSTALKLASESRTTPATRH